MNTFTTKNTKNEPSSNIQSLNKRKNFYKMQMGFQTPLPPNSGPGTPKLGVPFATSSQNQFNLQNKKNIQDNAMREESQKTINDFVLAYNLTETKKHAWLFLIHLMVVTGITKRLQNNWQLKTAFTSAELILLSLSNPWLIQDEIYSSDISFMWNKHFNANFIRYLDIIPLLIKIMLNDFGNFYGSHRSAILLLRDEIRDYFLDKNPSTIKFSLTLDNVAKDKRQSFSIKPKLSVIYTEFLGDLSYFAFRALHFTKPNNTLSSTWAPEYLINMLERYDFKLEGYHVFNMINSGLKKKELLRDNVTVLKDQRITKESSHILQTGIVFYNIDT